MIYAIPNGDDKLRIKFNRELFNYSIQSHKGKYKSKSKGILNNYEKLTKSCILFDHHKLNEIKNLCAKLNINTRFFEINKPID